MKTASNSGSVVGKGNTRTCTNASSSKGELERGGERGKERGGERYNNTSQVHFFIQDRPLLFRGTTDRDAEGDGELLLDDLQDVQRGLARDTHEWHHLTKGMV